MSSPTSISLLALAHVRRAVVALCLVTASVGCAGRTPAQTPHSLAEVSGEELRHKASEFASRGDWVAAEQYLQAAKRAGADERLVVSDLVRVCVASERYETALAYVEPYLSRHPHDWLLKQVVATIYLSQGRLFDAQRTLKDVLREAPAEAPAHFMMGSLEGSHFGRHDLARSHFETYLALAPTGEYAEEARHWIAMQASNQPQELESLRSTP